MTNLGRLFLGALTTALLAVESVAPLFAQDGQKSADSNFLNSCDRAVEAVRFFAPADNQPVTAGSTNTERATEFGKDVCALLQGIRVEEPGHINNALAAIITPSSGLAFLKDIQFRVKAFEPHNGEDGSLGFSYDYSKVEPLGDFDNDVPSGVISGWSWNLTAKGNVAFDSDTNPVNFLDTRFAVSGFRNKWLARETQFPRAELDRLEDLRSRATTQAQLDDVIAQSGDIVAIIRSELPRVRSYIDFNLNAGLESDQKFDQKQWTYGGQVALDFKAYDRSAWQTTFNVLDWPFAVIRRLSGYDSRFQVYGSTLPTLVLAIEQVDVKDNLARESLGVTGKFDRYRGEVFFRTPIARIGSDELFFNFDYRYLKERDPLPQIVDAGIDDFKYTVVSISSSRGLYLTYRDGVLPFDLAEQQVYELGWKFNLAGL